MPAYDRVGNRLSIDEQSLQEDNMLVTRNLSYEYDERYQLTLESWAGQLYTYDYDRAGNRVGMEKNGTLTSYTYNVRNEITGWSRTGEACTYQHDDNGNRILKTVNGVATAYDYDVNDRLIEVDTEYNGVTFVPDFEASYDYRTRRVTKTENAETTVFRYDGGVSFDEWKDGMKQVEFVRGSGMGGGIGSILYSERPAEPEAERTEYFVYCPAVGHTTATLTGEPGFPVAVKSTNLYEAFGNIVVESGASDNNRLANTKERDESIGLDNHGFRYYDPEIGRYTTRDPIGYGAGMNVYLSVRNNPINHVDPLGLDNGDDDLLTFALKTAGEWLGIELGVSGPEGQKVGVETAQQVKITGRVLKGVVQEEAAKLEHMARHPRETLEGIGEAAEETYEQAKTGVEMAAEDPKRAALLLKDAAIRKAEQLKELPEWALEHRQEYQAAVSEFGGKAAIAGGKAKLFAGAGRGLKAGMKKGLEKVAPGLAKWARAGRGKNVAVITGSKLEARATFDRIRGKAPFKEVKPGVFVAKLKSGGFATFRPKSTSGSPAVEVNKVPGVGYMKVHFVEK